jgi:hypothetical protein
LSLFAVARESAKRGFFLMGGSWGGFGGSSEARQVLGKHLQFRVLQNLHPLILSS